MLNTKYVQISGIERESIVDGEGIRYVIFVQGCPHHCLGCQNPQTHSFADGVSVSIAEIMADISKRRKYITGITLSGGEPFCQIEQCTAIAEEARKMGLTVWCYTGFLYEDLLDFGKRLLEQIDVLVDGPFDNNERSLGLPFKGSANQRIIDISRSLKTGKVQLYYGK